MITIKGFIFSLNWFDIGLFIIVAANGFKGFRSGAILPLIQGGILYILFAAAFHANSVIVNGWGHLLRLIPGDISHLIFYTLTTLSAFIVYKIFNGLVLKPLCTKEVESIAHRMLGFLAGCLNGFLICHYLVVLGAEVPLSYVHSSILVKSVLSPHLIDAGWVAYKRPLEMLKLSPRSIEPINVVNR